MAETQEKASKPSFLPSRLPNSLVFPRLRNFFHEHLFALARILLVLDYVIFMRQPASLALRVLLMLAILGPWSGCCIMGLCKKRTPKEVTEPKVSKYDKLANKAEEGDIGAARELAKWCYVHDPDNSRVKHWLEVAAKNGDSSSAKVAEYTQDWQ